MQDSTQALVGIVRTVPLLFHRLRAIGDALHAEHGVTTPMRGVMRSLYDEGPMTVPQLAAARPVSRQHIQTQVDALSDRGLVRSVANPAHKRSPLIALTDAGRKLFAKMQATEAEILAGLSAEFPPSQLETTERTIASLAERFASLLTQMKEVKDEH